MDGKPDPNDSGPFAAAYRDGWNADRPEDNPYTADDDFLVQQLARTWTRGLVARLDSKHRVSILWRMKQSFCANEAEDRMDGTQFDLDVIAALDALIKKWSEM